MAAISNNKYQVFEWIKNVIDSCETPTQLVKTSRLISSFDDLYQDWFLKSSLYDYKDIKLQSLFNQKTYK
jgi:hypothetical protein